MTQLQENPSTTATPVTHELPPPLALLKMLTGMMSTRAIQVAAKFGIADLLASGPKGTEELAQATGTHAPSLYRLLRFLASQGIFSETQPGVFEQTTLSHFLQTGVHGSMRDMARMWGDDWRWETWGELAYSIQTGRPAFDRIYGKNLWEYFAQDNHPAGRLFSMAMTNFSEAVNHHVVEAFDFSDIRTLVDVGGAHGSLLTAILQQNPGLTGVLFDLPPVIEGAKETIDRAGLADRCRLEAGNFFEKVPEGADAYILKFIIHDWDDAHCQQILGNIRQGMQPGGRVVIVEEVIPDGDAPAFGKLLDLEMLAILTGRERTAAEFEKLYSGAGLKLSRIIPTHSNFSLIEGVAV